MFDDKLVDNQLQALNVWVPFFTTLMMVIYGFYFGSRGIEKVQKIRAVRNKELEEAKKQIRSIGQEPKG